MKNSIPILVAILTFSFINAQKDAISEIDNNKQEHNTKNVVSGVVKDGSGNPLPGAIVVIKGTEIGTQTDFEGNFKIMAEKDAILIFRYIGFKSKTIKIKDSDNLLIKLREDATVCFPSADYYLPFKIYEFDDYTEKWNTPNDIYNTLLKVPGMRLQNTNNSLSNTPPSITMRGDVNTVVILDGIRYDASILTTLNPQDIESIKVAPSVAATNYFLSGSAQND
ncbi:carboxypeptidase-like regulatory domain-containing protein [Maribacter sp. 2304DJ31-5]|uniref:carboxypeptidase-like regulatory domain-containing protein n=1 Tax=Maribacter sp. 2304DJ31-5 TaxID=3386273 RepID=UPI0039BD8657